MIQVLKDNGFHAPLPFRELVKLTDGFISTGDKMGEGWLLTAEMIELVRAGYENIVCAQPFGCLPNHICGKGMINKIREIYPQANITPIDYDPSATRVNQENRIKLMIAVARERLAEKAAGAAAPVSADAQPAAEPRERLRCDRLLCKTCRRGGPIGSAAAYRKDFFDKLRKFSELP